MTDTFSFIGQFQSADSLNWTVISAEILPWTSEFGRNPLGLAISSTYESGDDNTYFTEVKFYGHDIPFFEYKIEFTETRSSESMAVQSAELELPGLLIADSNTAELSMAPPTQ